MEGEGDEEEQEEAEVDCPGAEGGSPEPPHLDTALALSADVAAASGPRVPGPGETELLPL